MKKYILSLLVIFAIVTVCSAQNNPEIKVADDISLYRLTDKTYIHVTAFQTQNWGRVYANGILLIDNGEAFILDTPWDNEQTEELYSWLADSMGVKVTTVIPNHWHEDCMGGLEFLHSKGVHSVANQMTIDIARKNGLPVPQQGFNDSFTLNLHGIEVICYYPGGGHATDNIVVYIPSEKLLFPGCFSKDMKATNLGNVADGDVNTWGEAIDRVMEKFPDAEIVVPGHGKAGGRELLRHTKELLEKNKEK